MKRDFKKYLNPYFIETGSYKGEGIQAALDAGFEKVISFEKSEKYYDLCKAMFSKCPNVSLWFGDSIEWLPIALKGVFKPCTFWLDAHYSGGDTAEGGTPILKELEIITQRIGLKLNIIEGDIILIDDMRLYRKGWDGITDKDIEKALAGYDISYEYGVAENDILIAQ